MRQGSLGRFIRERRKVLGLTQEVLADRCGAHAPYISMIESGKRTWPQKHISALARELGVSEVEMAIVAGVISPTGMEVQEK